MREALLAFGPGAYYGVDLVELRPAPARSDGLSMGSLAGPGHIVLYDQPRSPWHLGFPLKDAELARLSMAGAEIDELGVIYWPQDTLKRFMLRHVLTHELGHHLLQHERRLRGERGARTRDHEARADVIAARLRALLR